MSTIDPADLLALLEEKPYHATELAELLAVLEDQVTAALRQLHRTGQVKRVGMTQKWALPSFDAGPGGRRAVLDRDACQAGILTALINGPLQTRAIVEVARFSRTAVKDELDALLQAGKIQHLGVARWSRWALPTWTPTPKPERPAVIPTSEKLHGDRGRRIYPKTTDAAGAPLRQKAPASNGDGSWWVGLSREALNAGVALRAEAMRGTKENLQVPFRMLK